MVILDGHHRVSALRLLGCALTPVYLVDYEHPSIKVTRWRHRRALGRGIRHEPRGPQHHHRLRRWLWGCWGWLGRL